MAYEVLKYASGVAPGSQDDPQARARRQGEAMQRLVSNVGGIAHRQKMTTITESKKAALADAVQGTIDPARQANDAAYASTILRNDLHSKTSSMHAKLDDPAGPYGEMDPEEFSKMFQEDAKGFYEANKESKHSNILAGIYGEYTLKNNIGMIAKQAKLYKDNMKKAQGSAAIQALVDLPPGKGDPFALNTQVLISDMLPEDRFTTDERRDIILGAARGAVDKGDDRLLNFAKRFYDAELEAPVQTAAASAAFSKWEREREDVAWAGAELARQTQAETGTYTEEQYRRDMSDPETVRRFGKATIKSWKRTSHLAEQELKNIDELQTLFLAGKPMTGYKPADQQKAIMAIKRDIIMEEGDMAKAMPKYAGLLAKSGVVDKELLMDFSARFGAPAFTEEQIASDDFQDAVAMANFMHGVMTPSQMKAQLGEQGWRNFGLWRQHMEMAKGDPNVAAGLYMATQNRLKDREKIDATAAALGKGGISGTGLERRQIDEAVDLLIEGRLDNSDPHVNTFLGMGSKTDTALFRASAENDIVGRVQALMNLGYGKDPALQQALDELATEYKYLGGEMVDTAGASIPAYLGLYEGATDKEAYGAYDEYMNFLGLDPERLRPVQAGPYISFADENGKPVFEQAAFPAAAVGEWYNIKKAKRDELQAAKDAAQEAQDILDANRKFESYAMNGARQNMNVKLTKSGKTLNDYIDASDEERSIIRRTHNSERGDPLRKVMDPIINAIKSIWDSEPDPKEGVHGIQYMNQDAQAAYWAKWQDDGAEADDLAAEAAEQEQMQAGAEEFQAQKQSYQAREEVRADAKAMKEAKAAEQVDVPKFKVKGMSAKSPAFRTKTAEVAENIGIKPDELAAIIKMESSFDHRKVNKKSKAYGLIQFTGPALKDLGVTRAELKKMDEIEQLDLTQKWFELWAKRGRPIKDISDAYMTVFWPRAIGQSMDYVLYTEDSNPKAYKQNRMYDYDNDGTVTKEEASRKVRKFYQDSLKG